MTVGCLNPPERTPIAQSPKPVASNNNEWGGGGGSAQLLDQHSPCWPLKPSGRVMLHGPDRQTDANMVCCFQLVHFSMHRNSMFSHKKLQKASSCCQMQTLHLLHYYSFDFSVQFIFLYHFQFSFEIQFTFSFQCGFISYFKDTFQFSFYVFQFQLKVQ